MKNYVGELGYIKLLEDILLYGTQHVDRTDVGSCLKYEPACLEFNYNSDEAYPLFTVRPVPERLAFEEFWFFLSGNTDTKILEEKGCNFWKGHTSSSWHDKVGLSHLAEGDMGKTYGYQLRNFGGVDQISKVYNELLNNKHSRRHLVSMWNPADLDQGVLPPCWCAHQFVIRNDALDLIVYSRSADLICGLSFNVVEYAMYQTAMANAIGLKRGSLNCIMADPHIYSNHLEYAHELITREVHKDNKVLRLNAEITSLKELLELEWSDWSIARKVNTSKFTALAPIMAI